MDRSLFGGNIGRIRRLSTRSVGSRTIARPSLSGWKCQSITQRRDLQGTNTALTAAVHRYVADEAGIILSSDESRGCCNLRTRIGEAARDERRQNSCRF